jgi:hypothetical protein
MQTISTTCDICNDGKTAANTVDVSWIQPGHEVDLCEKHRNDLTAIREQLSDFWIAPARRIVTRPMRRQRRTGTATVPPRTHTIKEGVEGVDFKISKSGRRIRLERVNCPECGKSFESRLSLAAHSKAHREVFPCKSCTGRVQQLLRVAVPRPA